MKAIYLLPILFLAALSFAAATEVKPVIVTGHVYMQGTSNPVPNILVTATCPKDTGVSYSNTTNAAGQYQIEFTAQECAIGDTVHICAGDDTNCADVMVKESSIFKNLVYHNFEIPEFTWVAAGIALVGAGLGFMLLRKKN